MIFLMESIAACLLFTLMLELVTRNRREAFANDYPPVVTEKLRALGLIAPKPPAKKNLRRTEKNSVVPIGRCTRINSNYCILQSNLPVNSFDKGAEKQTRKNPNVNT